MLYAFVFIDLKTQFTHSQNKRLMIVLYMFSRSHSIFCDLKWTTSAIKRKAAIFSLSCAKNFIQVSETSSTNILKNKKKRQLLTKNKCLWIPYFANALIQIYSAILIFCTQTTFTQLLNSNNQLIVNLKASDVQLTTSQFT